jgi:hypothetical protein
MTRYPSLVDPGTWVDVSPACPCRVCGGVSKCTMLESDDFVLCRQGISEWPMLGGGWLHRFVHRPLQNLEPEQGREAVMLPCVPGEALSAPV